MANTIAYGDGTIMITFDGSTAWDSGQLYKVLSFEFLPAANSDAIRVRDGSATGVTVFRQIASASSGASDQRKGYEYGYDGQGKNIQPYVVGNEATVNSILIVKYA